MKEMFPEHDFVPKDGLSDRDKDNLYMAGQSMLGQFLDDYPDEFPDALIFPDLAARPLAYLVAPVIHRAAQERGVATPEAVFFKICSKGMRGAKHWEWTMGESLEEYVDRNTGYIDRITEKRRLNPNPLRKAQAQWYLHGVKKRLRTPQNLLSTRTLMRDVLDKRSADIYDAAHRQGVADPTFAIIDESVSGLMLTHSELERSLGQEIPVYGFLLNHHPDTYPSSVSWGMVNPYENSDLDYISDRTSIGYMKEDDVFSPYPTPFGGDEKDVKAMTKLRQDMRAIGERLAQELVPTSSQES